MTQHGDPMRGDREEFCWTCLGQGFVYQALRRTCWPCPHCEGAAHPALGPAAIRTHAR